MKKFEYKYNFEPEMYKYILSTNILNKKKDEHKILEDLQEHLKQQDDILEKQNEILYKLNGGRKWEK